jgi:hypothetical protein
VIRFLVVGLVHVRLVLRVEFLFMVATAVQETQLE